MKMTTSGTTSVISICSLNHADVWRLTSQLLPVFVPADDYTVYVPENELPIFKKLTDPRVRVLSQGLLGVPYAELLKREIEKKGNLRRYGWYLQQFYKIEALLNSHSDDLIIWDADCVPVAPQTLFDEKRNPVFIHANEFNEEYFRMIERLLGLARVQNQSFVIPGFPTRSRWIREFTYDVEVHNEGLNWYEAIIFSTNLGLTAGFSETETLGTWMANKYPEAWQTSKVAWERMGQGRYGYARDFTVETILNLGYEQGLEIISFENWDPRGTNRLVPYIKRALSINLRSSKDSSER